MKRSRELEDELDFDSQEPEARSVAVSERTSKLTQLDSAIEDGEDDEAVTMRCDLPPHREPFTFRSYGDYEVHYSKFHTNRCLQCHKNFPTQHLLDVHIEESHDPLVLVRRDKGEHTYSCFVEGCERKCMTHQKRRMHLIDKHMYPKNFFFAVTRDGIDGRRSLLNDGSHHRRRSSTSAQVKESRRRASLLESKASQPEDAPKSEPVAQGRDAGETDKGESVDKEMEDITGAMSALQFVPPSIRFGKGRAGFSTKR